MVSLSDYEEQLLKMGYTYDEISELGADAKNNEDTSALSELEDIFAALGLWDSGYEMYLFGEQSISDWTDWWWDEKGAEVSYDDELDRWRADEDFYDEERDKQYYAGNLLYDPYFPQYLDAARYWKL